jgi:fermentation-respiration switch protein FrsA (DUF1100 family)
MPTPTRTRPALSVAWRVLRVVTLVYLLILLAMLLMENSLIFFPAPYPAGVWDLPAADVEDAWFTTPDGHKLHGWFAPNKAPRAVLLFLHGNAGNITHRDDRLLRLRSLGFSVLVFDYRGYGRSEGSPSEKGVLIDARAARAWLAQRAGVTEQEIVLWGESLGGGVAVDLAAKDGARGLILESTFTSLPDVAAYHYRWLPVRWVMRSRLDALGQIGQYHGPLLCSHGEADEIVPYEMGQRLFAAANEPKECVSFPGGFHNGPPHPEDRENFRAALERFLARLESR